MASYYEKKLKDNGLTALDIYLADFNGIYYKENNKIYFTNRIVHVGYSFVEVKPCYAVKETTLESCYYGDVSPLKEVEDAHYWDWKTSRSWKFEDYKKTWAFKREELEDE